jgi:hypothetical protein
VGAAAATVPCSIGAVWGGWQHVDVCQGIPLLLQLLLLLFLLLMLLLELLVLLQQLQDLAWRLQLLQETLLLAQVQVLLWLARRVVLHVCARRRHAAETQIAWG